MKYKIDGIEIYGYEKPRKLIVNHLEDEEVVGDFDFLTAFFGFLLIAGFISYMVIIWQFPALADNTF